MTEIETRVRKIVSSQLGVPESDIRPDSAFVEDLGADSLDTVELLMALEDAFDFEIPDEEAKALTTVRAVVAYAADRIKTEA